MYKGKCARRCQVRWESKNVLFLGGEYSILVRSSLCYINSLLDYSSSPCAGMETKVTPIFFIIFN